MTGRNLFSKRSRLSNPAQFREVFTHGRRYNTEFFTAVVKPSEVGYARLGLAISKRKARLAVQRNRLKRLIRESFRVNQQRLINLDIIVIPRSRAPLADAATLRAALQELWTLVGWKMRGPKTSTGGKTLN